MTFLSDKRAVARLGGGNTALRRCYWEKGTDLFIKIAHFRGCRATTVIPIDKAMTGLLTLPDAG